MRVVLDTNTLIVSIGTHSKYRPIFDAILSGKISLIISNDIISEYAEILERKANSILADNVTSLLVESPYVDKVEIYFKWAAISRDADDNKFVDCALNGRARYIVTDDKHFRQLKKIEFPEIEVIRTKDFLNLIQNA